MRPVRVHAEGPGAAGLFAVIMLLLAASGDAGQNDASPSPSAVMEEPEPFFEEVNLQQFFGQADGTFVLQDAHKARTRCYNPERARTRFIPASTFKIPNSLIALESGIASGPDFALSRDSSNAPRQVWWPDVWARDHSLRTAFTNSVFWFYQELARRIGAKRMQTYLGQFSYGNEDISGAIDQFWLQGELRISPTEQVRFLRRLYFGELGVSERTTEIVKSILILEETPEYRLSGKTGTANLTATRELGWLVGYVESHEALHFYALNMEGELVWEEWPPQKRAELVRAILRELGVLPQTISKPSRD